MKRKQTKSADEKGKKEERQTEMNYRLKGSAKQIKDGPKKGMNEWMNK